MVSAVIMTASAEHLTAVDVAEEPEDAGLTNSSMSSTRPTNIAMIHQHRHHS